MNALSREAALPRVLCREIEKSDAAAAIDLLDRGFGRGRAFWARAFACMEIYEAPSELPHYGYLLESDGRLVGVLLTINSAVAKGGERSSRCNFSSWYVEPAYRAFAAMLVSRALRRKSVTYLNLTPAPATVAILKAQGYRELFAGTALALPWLRRPAPGSSVLPLDSAHHVADGISQDELRLLQDHASFGCISLVCRSGSLSYPFAFSRRRIGGIFPAALLVYCRDIDEFTLCAGALGRHLAKRGILFVMVRANAQIQDVPGIYLADRPTFYIGPAPPRAGDLAYTECAMLHV